MDQRVRVVHHERAQGQAQAPAVGEGEVVRSRDAHRPGLGVEAGREAPQRVDAAADPTLRLEEADVVPLELELPGRDEPGHARTDDHDALRVLGARLEALGRDAQDRAFRGLRDRVRPGEPRVRRVAHRASTTSGRASRSPASMAQAFLTAAAMAPSIQRRARRSQASLANQMRPTGRTTSS